LNDDTQVHRHRTHLTRRQDWLEQCRRQMSRTYSSFKQCHVPNSSWLLTPSVPLLFRRMSPPYYKHLGPFIEERLLLLLLLLYVHLDRTCYYKVYYISSCCNNACQLADSAVLSNTTNVALITCSETAQTATPCCVCVCVCVT